MTSHGILQGLFQRLSYRVCFVTVLLLLPAFIVSPVYADVILPDTDQDGSSLNNPNWVYVYGLPVLIGETGGLVIGAELLWKTLHGKTVNSRKKLYVIMSIVMGSSYLVGISLWWILTTSF